MEGTGGKGEGNKGSGEATADGQNNGGGFKLN